MAKANRVLASVTHTTVRDNIPFTVNEDVIEFATEIATMEGVTEADYFATCEKYFDHLSTEAWAYIQSIWNVRKAAQAAVQTTV